MPICSRRILHGHIADVNAIDLHRAAGHIIETRQQIDDGSLARTSWTHNGNGLPGLRSEGNIFEHWHTIFIRVRGVIEFHQAFDRRHLDAHWVCLPLPRLHREC